MKNTFRGIQRPVSAEDIPQTGLRKITPQYPSEVWNVHKTTLDATVNKLSHTIFVSLDSPVLFLCYVMLDVLYLIKYV